MRIHVTGGSGFLGGRVIPLLVGEGHAVTAMVRSPAAAERIAELGATPVPGDLDQPETVDEAFARSGADALVNLASLGFGHAPVIVAAAEEAGLKRAVFLSTTAIFTRLDAGSKMVRCAAEQAIRDSALEWTILRPTMIYGSPADRNMARLIRWLMRSPVMPIPGGGHRLQQPVHVDDLAGAVVRCLDSPEARCRDYDVGGPSPLTLRQVIGEAADAAGRRAWLVPVPLGPSVAVVRLYERLAARPRIRAEQLERLAEDKSVDIEPARRDLAFDPRPFGEGIRQEAALVR